MMRVAFLIVAASLLSACVSNPVPEGYKGPLASFRDTTIQRSSTSAEAFFLSEVNGRVIDDSAEATRRANAGRGLVMDAVTIGRQIPAEPCTVKIVGKRIYAAPILTLIRPSHEVSGEIKFTPKPNGNYHVNGAIDETYSAVWIEDDATKERVSEKIETGSAGPSGEGKSAEDR